MLAVAVWAMASWGQAQDKLPPGTRTGFVTTPDRVRIHYFEAGHRLKSRASLDGPSTAKRQKPTILFVPGWMTPGWIWENQIAHFSKNYRVVAIDPRSQGQSSKPNDGHDPASRARDIKHVVDQLKLAPVVLVACTSGVTEAASYVGQFGTQTLAGIVLVNGIVGREYDQATLSGLLSYANGFQLDRQKAADRFVRGLFTRPQSDDYVKKMVQATLRMPTDSAMALIVAGIATDNRQALTKIDKPTLIVVANFRQWMSFYEDLQKRIRGARLEVFDEAGHALFVDQAERFNKLLDEFLKTLAD